MSKKSLRGVWLLVIATLLAALLVTACNNTDNEKGSDEPREVRVTVIVDNIGDMSYNDGLVRELKQAEERYKSSDDIDLTVNVFSMETGSGNEQAEIERAFEQDSELIMIAYQIALPVLEPAAAYHPDKDFIIIDTEATGDNIYSALFKPGEAAYMCGFLAAKMSQTGIIGMVIGMEIPALYDFCVGYISGALAADPDCKVIISSVGNFYDAEIAYGLAGRQFEDGADICFSAAGGAGLGCIRAARDFDRYVIGVDVDQTEYVEDDLKGVILTSCLKNFDVLSGVVLSEYLNGTLTFGESGRFGLKEGAVGIARNSNYLTMVPEDIQAATDAQEELIQNGNVQVRSAFDMTQAEIDELLKSARP